MAPQDIQDPDLEEAQAHYYDCGGMPSQSTVPRKAPWYWRRAAKLWRDRCEVSEEQFKVLGDKLAVAESESAGLRSYIERLCQERDSNSKVVSVDIEKLVQQRDEARSASKVLRADIERLVQQRDKAVHQRDRAREELAGQHDGVRELHKEVADATRGKADADEAQREAWRTACALERRVENLEAGQQVLARNVHDVVVAQHPRPVAVDTSISLPVGVGRCMGSRDCKRTVTGGFKTCADHGSLTWGQIARPSVDVDGGR